MTIGTHAVNVILVENRGLLSGAEFRGWQTVLDPRLNLADGFNQPQHQAAGIVTATEKNPVGTDGDRGGNGGDGNLPGVRLPEQVAVAGGEPGHAAAATVYVLALAGTRNGDNR